MDTITSRAPGERDPPQRHHLALLAAWFSPACPIGAFSYSHGLETLQERGALGSAEAATPAIETALTTGAGRADAVLMCEAYRACLAQDADRLAAVAQTSAALAPSAERHAEATLQGEAFAKLVAAVWPIPMSFVPPSPAALSVVLGAAGAGHTVPMASLVQAFLHAFAANLISAAVRLVPLGQTDGQRLTARLTPTIIALVDEALEADPSDFGGAALGLDLASMAHETQTVRLFRS